MDSFIWVIVAVSLIALGRGVQSRLRQRRRVASYERHLWLQYTQLAAQRAEEWRGR